MTENPLDTDPRVTCTTCRHYRPLRCGNFRAAGLRHPDISRAMASLPQRCPGHFPSNNQAKA